MDDRLLALYEQELRHLRETASEFARANPRIAARLDLDPQGNNPPKDPYVERLLEGFAFLTSRVLLKFESEYPRFTQALLETIYPHFLAPTPSMTIVRFHPDTADAGLNNGFPVPRGTMLRSTTAPEGRSECRFGTAHNVTLWPMEIEQAAYFLRDLATLKLPPGANARAALRLQLATGPGIELGNLELDELTFFISAPEGLNHQLYEHIFTRTHKIMVRAGGPSSKPLLLPVSNLQQVGFSPEEALLPFDGRSFQGYRLLHEYFAMPERFLFFKISGIAPVLHNCKDSKLEIALLFDEAAAEFEEVVQREHFAMYCTPAINVFPMRTDRILLSSRSSENQVIVDRTRPLDFEIYQILKVTGYGSAPGEEQEFRSFYAANDLDAADSTSAFYSIHRVPRTPSAREKERLGSSPYIGSEVYLMLVDARNAPYSGAIQELGLQALCTNRDLPRRLPASEDGKDFLVDADVLVRKISRVKPPTRPRFDSVEGDGDLAWRAISHLSLNYLSLLDDKSGRSIVALRDLLKLYGDPHDIAFRKHVESLLNVSCKPVIRRISSAGLSSFVRGLEISLDFDDSIQASGVFLFGSVLDHFFAKYVSINSFIETVVSRKKRGVIKRWPPMSGTRPLL